MGGRFIMIIFAPDRNDSGKILFRPEFHRGTKEFNRQHYFSAPSLS